MIKDLTLEFSNTINVIEGQNEAGKSTVAAFIKYMLYGFDNNVTEDGEGERQKRLSWEDGTAAGSMTVLVKDKRYLITRSTSLTENTGRPVYKEESSITDLETGSPAFGRVPAGEVFFGVDKELFENTAFVGQIGDSAINRGSVKESIENILFSGNERMNNQRAASKVSEKMESLLGTAGRGGAIFELERRSSEFEERFRKADEINRDILAKEAKLHEIRADREKEMKHEEKLIELDKCYDNMVIIKSFDDLHDYERHLEEKNEEYIQFVSENTVADFVPDGKYLTDLSLARRGVDDGYRSTLEAENEYERAKGAVGITHEIENAIFLSDDYGGEDAVGKKATKYARDNVKNIFLIVLMGLAAIAACVVEIVASGVLAGALFRVLFAVVGASALGGIIFSAFKMRKNKCELVALQDKFATGSLSELRTKLAVIGEARRKRDNMIDAIESARLALDGAREDFARAKEELNACVAKWGGKIPAENINEYLDNLDERVRAFLDGESKIRGEKVELEIKVRETRQLLSGKSEVGIRAQVSPLKRKVLSEIDHEGIISGINMCREKILSLEAQAKKIEEELVELKLAASDPAELYSKMQANEARIAELRENYEAYKIAYDAINCASDNLREEISPRLGEFSAEIMGIMTDKKYTDIDVSDGLKVSFLAPTGEKKSVDFMSGGTRELTYISVRMALIDMLYSEAAPIVFDESFAHQDNVRAKSMMRAIGYLADEGHQSFIFTCRAREAALAKEISKKTTVFRLSTREEAII